MSNFIDDIMGTPRKRSKAPARSPLANPSPLRREQSTDVFHSALAVPTQGSLASRNDIATPTMIDKPTASEATPSATNTAPSEVLLSEISIPAELPPAPEEIQSKATPQTQDEPATGLPEAPTTSAGGSEEDRRSALNVLPPMPFLQSRPGVLIGISGCAGSGKTMLSHLLSWVIPAATPRFVLHLDDFCIPKHFLIPTKDGELDADNRDAIDFEALIRVLRFFKNEGKLPSGFRTDQDETYEREKAGTLVSENILEEAKEILARSGYLETGKPVCILEGFLLYHESRIRELLDIKFFLRTTKEIAKARRFEKPDYVGDQPVEEFWKTQVYFDRVVWPNYVGEHGPLFKNGNVEKRHVRRICDPLGIHMQPQLEMSMEDVFRWAVSCIADKPETIEVEHSRSLDPEEDLLNEFEVCDCGEGWVGKVRKFLYDIA